MGTPCTIAYLDGDTIHITRCNYDGYPSGVGQVLTESFTEFDKVKKLVDGGELRTIMGKVEYYLDQMVFDSSYKVGTRPSVTENYNYLFKYGNWYLDGLKLANQEKPKPDTEPKVWSISGNIAPMTYETV